MCYITKYEQNFVNECWPKPRGPRPNEERIEILILYQVSVLYFYILPYAVNHARQLDIQLFRELVTNRLLVGMAPVESLYLSHLIAQIVWVIQDLAQDCPLNGPRFP